MSGRLKNAFWRIVVPGGIFVAIIAAIGFVGIFHPVQRPGTLMVIYASASSEGGETLWAAPYYADGRREGAPVRLGPLGLVAQTQIDTFDPKQQVLLITLGSAIRAVTGSGSQLFARVPDPWTALSIRWISGVLYAVVERPGQSHGSVWKFQAGTWRVVDNRLPEGIVTLVKGPKNLPTAWVAGPHHASTYVLESSGRWRYPEFRGGSPGGTVAFFHHAELVPYAKGAREFGQWIGFPNLSGMRRVIFPKASQAALGIVEGDRLWGIGALGMIPYQGLSPRLTDIRRWPMAIETTLVPVGSGAPWLVILDGPSQGIWFDTRTGQFGPPFTIILPAGDVVRAVAVKA